MSLWKSLGILATLGVTTTVNAQSFTLPLPPVSEDERLFALESASNQEIEGAEQLAELRMLRMAESLCGPDDMQDVELYDGTLGVTQEFVANHEPSTGQIQWRDDLADTFGDGAGNVSGVRWCTGTLIADDMFLTAGHCFDQNDDPFGWQTPARLVDGDKVLAEPDELATLMNVNFGFQIDAASGDLRDPTVVPIEEMLEYRIDGLDFAVVRLGQIENGMLPGKTFGIREMHTAGISAGDSLTVIQHPAGRPKKIEAGTETLDDGTFVTYGDLDTLGGSSGSGVLNDEGRIVAVHTNGGCGPFSGQNLALSLARIAQISAHVQ